MNEEGGECYPSIPTIAKDCGLKERAVFNHIKLAIDLGFIHKGKKNTKGQKWSTNTYTAINNMHVDAPLHVDALTTCTPVHSTPAPTCILTLQYNTPKNTPIKTKQKKPEAIKLPYETLPAEWLSFCQEEMQWSVQQSESAWLAFSDYWNGADCKKPKKKDWLLTFKNSCRSGITKPNINLTKRYGSYKQQAQNQRSERTDLLPLPSIGG